MEKAAIKKGFLPYLSLQLPIIGAYNHNALITVFIIAGVVT